jgi:hypothetical protein
MDYTNKKDAIGALELLYLAKDRNALIEVLKNQEIDLQLRQYASGLLARPWLPWGILRKGIMILLLLAGISAFIITQSFVCLLLVLLALLFSPRLVAEFLILFRGNSNG